MVTQDSIIHGSAGAPIAGASSVTAKMPFRGYVIELTKVFLHNRIRVTPSKSQYGTDVYYSTVEEAIEYIISIT